MSYSSFVKIPRVRMQKWPSKFDLTCCSENFWTLRNPAEPKTYLKSRLCEVYFFSESLEIPGLLLLRTIADSYLYSANWDMHIQSYCFIFPLKLIGTQYYQNIDVINEYS